MSIKKWFAPISFAVLLDAENKKTDFLRQLVKKAALISFPSLYTPKQLPFSFSGILIFFSFFFSSSSLIKGGLYKNWEDRKLSWYSLRHYGITQRVQSGVDLIDISQMAGTSVKHIESTYLKYRKEQSRTAALKSYKKQEGKIKHL